MSHAKLLPLLLPSSYAVTDQSLTAQLSAEGKALDSAQVKAQAVLGTITPKFVGEMLPDWERVLGLVPPSLATYQQRVDNAVAKLAQVGGLSIPYFIQLAEQLGYTIRIIEPQYPQAGVSHAGDTMWVPEVMWCWRVEITSAAIACYQAYAGTAVAGDPITAFQDPILEQVFNDLKPAFTYVYFVYGG